MTIDRLLRGIAGFFILASLGLATAGEQAALSSPTWLWLTGFVGLNLLQSAFTNWCPMITLLTKLGVPSTAAGVSPEAKPS